MAKATRSSKKPIEQYDHKAKKRVNNPPVGLVDAKSDAVEPRKTYAYDPHLDPTLVWAGKAERTSFDIPTVSLHVHERIDPRSIIEAVSGSAQQIAVWRLDTDYDGRSLFPRQVFFPMAADKEGWSKLARNLGAEIDEELIEAYRGTLSLPFELGKHSRVAVKIVDDRGIESLKVMEIS